MSRREAKMRSVEYLRSLLIEGGWRDELISGAKSNNLWFEPEMVLVSLDAICCEYLETSKLSAWVIDYEECYDPKRVGLLMAGNIPLVGFHDLICTWFSGHIAIVKLSSKDSFLMKAIIEKLYEIDPEIREEIVISSTLKGLDAVIATGSNNSNRYFEQYFGAKPHIFRQNRSSVAVLDGKETLEDLGSLAHDMCLYFGLGCRSVSKIFVPEAYDLTTLVEPLEKWSHLLDNAKYKNNYDYNYAIMLMNKINFYAISPILFVESEEWQPAISCVYYERYTNIDEINLKIEDNRERLQCVVSNSMTGHLTFGNAQSPGLDDYADGVNTMKFLKSIY